MITKKELEEMADVSVREVEPAELVELEDVNTKTALEAKERIKDFINQIHNPYCYKSNGMVIKVSFANNDRTLNDCVRDYITADCATN